MTAEQAIAFVLFAIVAAITPGPSNLILTSTGATVGVLRGLPCLFGVAIGMGLMLFLVAFGLGSLVLASPVMLLGLKWCGTGVRRRRTAIAAHGARREIVQRCDGSTTRRIRSAVHLVVDCNSFLH